jgi:hypothetical protein
MRLSMVCLLVLAAPALLVAGGCPGCGGYSGSAAGGLGMLGLVGSSFGETGNNLMLGYSASTFEMHDSTSAYGALQVSLNHWIQVALAGSYSHTYGDKVMYLDEIFDYDVSGMNDVGLMAWFDVLGINKVTPCPLDGDVSKVPDYFHLMIGAGATFPTGKYSYADEWGPYPAEYQLGTGTTDYVASLAAFKRFGKWQPQAAFLYKLSGGENPVGYWRSDSYAAKADLIYLFNPVRKGAVMVGATWSHVMENDRDYAWGPPGMYKEIDGTAGDTVNGYVAGGIEVWKGWRPGLAVSFPIYQQDGDDNFSWSLSAYVNYHF